MSPAKRTARRTTHATATVALLAVGFAIASLAALPAAVTADASVSAHAAHALSVNDSAHLHIVGQPGSALTEEGQATGTLRGRVRARLVVSATTVNASFTLYPSGGTISGSTTARLNAGKGEYASFGGSLRVTHGTGRYAHASGSGGLYGTIDRYNDNATVQVVGHLRY